MSVIQIIAISVRVSGFHWLHCGNTARSGIPWEDPLVASFVVGVIMGDLRQP